MVLSPRYKSTGIILASTVVSGRFLIPMYIGTVRIMSNVDAASREVRGPAG